MIHFSSGSIFRSRRAPASLKQEAEAGDLGVRHHFPEPTCSGLIEAPVECHRVGSELMIFRSRRAPASLKHSQSIPFW